MIVLGIDPGLSGGLAIVKYGHARVLLYAGDIPTTGEKAKRRVQIGAVLDLLAKYKPTHAVIERAQAMPDQGASSGFNYGRAVGSLEACVQGMQIPLTIIESSAWKKFHGLIKSEKENSRQRAIMLYPGATFFSRKLDHNRAEAALIADYGVSLLSGAPRPAVAAALPKPGTEPAQLDLIRD
jgi:crossover junction endodeoxyribonuclease RuvC